ncbi:MAG: hypothetical protein GYB26_11020 [Gammaproteobacteria bacterium]|nr:hypothetical protein [Gammaproteobacteria bacterium]
MKPVSFFWYLYGVVALALVLTVAVLFFTINYLENQSDWQDFARDVERSVRVAEAQCRSQQLSNPCVQSVVNDHGFDVIAYLQSDARAGASANAGSVIGEWQGDDLTISVYRYFDGFQASLRNQAQAYWVRDSEQHLQEAETDGFPLEVLATALLVTLLLLLSIGVFLLWPVKRLLGWISQLREATDALALGDYSVRIPTIAVHPFYQLANRFNRMIGLIQTNLEEKRLLANAMAHEMRTPLSRVRLALALLQRYQPQDDSHAALLQDLDRYIDELENVTSNSLQLVRLQNSEINCQRLDLKAWVEQKLRLRRGRTSSLSWEFELQPAEITTDEHFLHLIIDNLLNNAEQYARSRVAVTLGVHNGRLQLSISDDGPGIAEELRQQALQPFSRLDPSRDRRSGGIGLGLALVNTGCQRLNVHLSMASAQPGLRVVLIFPDREQADSQCA